MTKSQEIGKRIKKFRDSLGWSQQELADKVGCQPQTISKYEREGLDSADMIETISKVVGFDLYLDEYELEGSVNEIGLELLVELIRHSGYLPFSVCLKDFLYGLSEEKAIDEILKLTRLGLCYREKYKDFDGYEKDTVFLTAKGLITCKHRIANPSIEAKIEENITKVVTYEQRLKGDSKLGIKDAHDYQEYIGLRPLEKAVRQLPLNHRRLNYIVYLKKAFEKGIGATNFINRYYKSTGELVTASADHPMDIFISEDSLDTIDISLCPGNGIQMDILHSMLGNIWKCGLDDLGAESLDPALLDPNKCSYGHAMITPDWKDTLKGSSVLPGYWDNETACESNEPDNTDSLNIDLLLLNLKDYYDRQHLYSSNKGSIATSSAEYRHRLDDHFRRAIQKKVAETGSNYPNCWFTMDEIEKFVRYNIRPVDDKKDSKVDQQLLELNKRFPQTLDYYRFSPEWEERGLGDYIRSCYGIDALVAKH